MSDVAGVCLSVASGQSVMCPPTGPNVLAWRQMFQDGAKRTKLAPNAPSWRQTLRIGAKRWELVPNVPLTYK